LEHPREIFLKHFALGVVLDLLGLHRLGVRLLVEMWNDMKEQGPLFLE
jgi:hypothetical protein